MNSLAVLDNRDNLKASVENKFPLTVQPATNGTHFGSLADVFTYIMPPKLTRRPTVAFTEGPPRYKEATDSQASTSREHDLRFIRLGDDVDIIKYATSYAIATVDTGIPTRVAPLGEIQSAAAQFRLDLFNIGGNRNPNPYYPRFEGGYGDYHFYADRDREIAQEHGFSSVKEIFDYLNAFLDGEAQYDTDKFTTPWHEIDLIFAPRKRKQSEQEVRRAQERQSMALTALPSPDALTAGPKQSPDESQPIQAICLDDIIQAVIRHPLLLPDEPVSIEQIITCAPHLLNGASVLWVLAHNGYRNEVVSQMLSDRGIAVPPNVIAHRKKAALEHMGGTYKERKVQYEEFRRSMSMVSMNGVAA